jgi:DNA-binding PadR family transcriptional regulator
MRLPFLHDSVSAFIDAANDVGIDRLVRKYRRGMVNSLLEYLVLTFLEKERMCGYDIITLLHERFHILLSPGQVYPVIDFMAEQGLIYKERHGRAVLLATSHLGKSLLRAWQQEFSQIQMQVNNLAIRELAAV